MVKSPGKSSSNKIINREKQEVVPGKKNMRSAYPKDKLEFNHFSSPA